MFERRDTLTAILASTILLAASLTPAWAQQGELAKLLPWDGAPADAFGQSVGISGDVAIVGAWGDDDKGANSGSAYIFRFDGSIWADEAKLLAWDGSADDRFSKGAVAVSGDVALVGACRDDDIGYNTGSVYVYYRSTDSTWAYETKLLPSDGAGSWDRFGVNVALDGNVAIVAVKGGGHGMDSGSAYVYRRAGSTWAEEDKFMADDAFPGDYFGRLVAISGDVAIVTALNDDDNGSGSGSAYVYRFSGTWNQEAKLLACDGAPGDQFGNGVAVAGDVAVFGAPGDDDNGADSGSAYVYRYDGSSWASEAKLLPSDGTAGDRFGTCMAIDGHLAIISARYDDDNGEDSGSAYFFRYDGSAWVEVAKLLASDGAAGDDFGCSAGISGDCAIVGGRYDDDNGTDSGSAYVFAYGGPANQPPVADAGGPYSAQVGEEITFEACASYDPDGTVVGYRWDFDDDAIWDTDWDPTCTVAHTYDAEYHGQVRVQVKDNDCAKAIATATVDVVVYVAVTYDGDTLLSTEGAPTADANLIASLRDEQGNVVDVDGEEVTFTLTAEGLDQIVTSALTVDGVAHTVLALEPAIYGIELTLAGSDITGYGILVVYNPEGGFATGGGWIVPEDDGENTHPNVRANFGFNAKYKQGDSTGHIEFRYSDGYVDLKSTSIELLVITGGKIVQFQGWARVNGEEGHWFFVKAIDNGEPGVDTDVFDIKIWAPGADPEGDPTERCAGVLQGGNIVVHTG